MKTYREVLQHSGFAELSSRQQKLQGWVKSGALIEIGLNLWNSATPSPSPLPLPPPPPPPPKKKTKNTKLKALQGLAGLTKSHCVSGCVLFTCGDMVGTAKSLTVLSVLYMKQISCGTIASQPHSKCMCVLGGGGALAFYMNVFAWCHCHLCGVLTSFVHM